LELLWKIKYESNHRAHRENIMSLGLTEKATQKEKRRIKEIL